MPGHPENRNKSNGDISAFSSLIARVYFDFDLNAGAGKYAISIACLPIPVVYCRCRNDDDTAPQGCARRMVPGAAGYGIRAVLFRNLDYPTIYTDPAYIHYRYNKIRAFPGRLSAGRLPAVGGAARAEKVSTSTNRYIKVIWIPIVSAAVFSARVRALRGFRPGSHRLVLQDSGADRGTFAFRHVRGVAVYNRRRICYFRVIWSMPG